MTRAHLSALFASKVFYSCRRLGITPWTEGRERYDINLNILLAEAEAELGIAVSSDELARMTPQQRQDVEGLALERKRFAYSDFLKRTSATSPNSNDKT